MTNYITTAVLMGGLLVCGPALAEGKSSIFGPGNSVAAKPGGAFGVADGQPNCVGQLRSWARKDARERQNPDVKVPDVLSAVFTLAAVIGVLPEEDCVERVENLP